jgi:hypothetical protein
MLGRVWLAIRLPSFRPASGWHIEPWFNTSREISDAYVHNGADIKQWRIDVATSFLWNFLTRQQQREILDGKTSIENFRTAEEIDEVTIDPTIIARPSTTHMMTQRKLTMTIPAEVRMSATQSPSGSSQPLSGSKLRHPAAPQRRLLPRGAFPWACLRTETHDSIH